MGDYKKIRKLFNSLNEDKTHFNSTNDICTPMGCVEEMVDSIPDELWHRESLKILDPCAGNGNFHAYISTKTELSNLYFNEISDIRANNIKKIFGYNVNLTKKDFLITKDVPKYDLIVGNPPYAKFTNGKRTAKNHGLSKSFIEKAFNQIKDGGYLLFIVPDNWMSYADRNKLPNLLTQYQFEHINIHGAKKWFPGVGSSFTWFLLKKVKKYKKTIVDNNYKMKEISDVDIIEKMDFIPLFFNDIVSNIIRKTIYKKKVKTYNIETTSDLHKYTKRDLINKEENEKFKYRLIHTPRQNVWASRPHKYQKGYKVFISLTTQYEVFIDECGMTQSIAFIRAKNRQDAEKIKKELSNDYYYFMVAITRYGNFNNTRVLQKLPILNQIELNEEEWSFIKTFNKTYYNN